MITSRNSSREDTYHIIKTYRPTFEQNLTRETADDREPHLKAKNLLSYNYHFDRSYYHFNKL